MAIRRTSAKEWGKNMVHSLPDDAPTAREWARFARYTLRMLEHMTSEQFAHGRDKGIRRRARKLLGIEDY